ncbi:MULTISPECIES: rhodanese-like domain-containing protein [unclassified Leifsonia]|uniref:rhodanese-like domain-containing protein n=1 Tax=unclassified Leifsonia TaxID=2663824 RepID=UPI000A199F9F|nr:MULTISPECIES: rhodanese-like domain-containing protein [unclassified Leifsonia]
MSGSYLSEDEVSAERAHELVESGSAWLLDVREAHEWEAGHAPAAHHIPLYEIESRQHELPEDQQILVVCLSGGRSRLATDALNRADYPTANVAGGMYAWQASGAPVVRDDGSPGAVA